MYVNEKMSPVEIIPGTGGGGKKEYGGGHEFISIYLIYFKNFCKWYNLPSEKQFIFFLKRNISNTNLCISFQNTG
jgi:hypothetical protein